MHKTMSRNGICAPLLQVCNCVECVTQHLQNMTPCLADMLENKGRMVHTTTKNPQIDTDNYYILFVIGCMSA